MDVFKFRGEVDKKNLCAGGWLGRSEKACRRCERGDVKF